MALGTGRRRGRVQRKSEKNSARRARPGKHERPINRTIRRIACAGRVFPGGVDHAPRRVRITHRAAHGGRRTSLAERRTAARDRRQLRGGLDRAGRERFLGRRGGRRGLRRGLRAGAASAADPAETGPSASATCAASSATPSPAATTAATASARGGGTAASTASPASCATTPSAPGTSTEALAPTEAPGADRAAGTPARRAAHVPQTDPQRAAERTVTGVADAAHHRPGGVRRCRSAAAVIPLTRRDACPNGSY